MCVEEAEPKASGRREPREGARGSWEKNFFSSFLGPAVKRERRDGRSTSSYLAREKKSRERSRRGVAADRGTLERKRERQKK